MLRHSAPETRDAIARTLAFFDPLHHAKSITAPTLPGWLTLVDNHNGTATLSGKPTDANVGLSSVLLRVSDGSATSDQTFGIQVSAAPVTAVKP